MSHGRPTKLTPEVANRLFLALRRGAFIETAVAMAGIAKSTFYFWLRKGEHDLEAGRKATPAAQFSDAIKKALAECEVIDLDIIRRASAKHWQAAAWRLERRFPERWGRRKLEISGPDGGPIQSQDAGDGPDLALLSDEELDQYEALMVKLAGGT